MAERPDEYELDDYPEREQKGEYDNRPINHEEEKLFQENSLRGENYKKFRSRQQMIKSNKVNVRKSFLKGSQTEVKILKRTILSDILDIPYDEVDETKFDLMIEPVDIETFKLYYGKNKILLEYNSKDDRITILSKDNFERFKVKYVNETVKRYAEKEMKTDFSIKSDLSAIDLVVRQSESEEYHKNLENLEREVSRLKQVEDDSIEKSRRIEELEDKLRETKVDSDEIESLKDSLRIKSIQIVESQREIERLRENIENLEKEIEDSSFKNLDEIEKQLDKSKKEYKEKLDVVKRQRDFYESEVDRLKEKLSKSIDEKQKDLQESVKKIIEEAHDEKIKSISIQESLKSKIVDLEKEVKKYEILYSSEKAINEDRELQLNNARKDIDGLRESLTSEIDNYNSMMDTYKRKIDGLKSIIENNKEREKEQENSLKDQKKVYEDIIEKNRVEIGSLRFEKRALEDTAENLNREIQQSENINEVLTTQLDRVNTEILGLNGRIQELQTQNQTLTTELDALISNFGNLVAASEATNHNNTLEIGRLKIKIKELEDNDDINEQVNELLKSVDNYKHLLDDAYEDKKKLKKEFEEKFDKLNKEKEGLVQDLKNKSKNEEDLMKKLWQNENNYSLLTQKYEKTFSTIYDLTLALDKTSEREKILEAELEYKKSRIKAKDEEVAEKKIEIEKLEKQLEDSNFNIKNSDFYERQYNRTKIELDKTISERNKYIQDLNNSRGDNEELEGDIEILEKEIEVLKKDRDLAKSKIIPKEIVNQMKHDNQELNKQLDVKEKQVKELAERHRIAKDEYDMAMNNFNKLKKKVDRKLDLIKKSYEKELEISRKKLTKTISPGELKALNVFLEDLDIEDYDKVDYDTQIKKLRSAREKFKRLIDDPSTDKAHKLQYKYLDDLMQYRIDFLNIEFKKPIETVKGRDYLIRTDNSWSPLGMLKKIGLAMKDSPGTTASLFIAVAFNTAFAVYCLLSSFSKQSKKSIVDGGKNLIKITKVEPSQKVKPPSQKVKPPAQKVKPPAQKVKPPAQKVDKAADVAAGGSTLYGILSSIPSYILSFVEKAINLIDWIVENFYKLILAGIITSVTLHNMYGEEMSFPILSFWSFVLAIAIVSMTTLGYLPSWITG